MSAEVQPVGIITEDPEPERRISSEQGENDSVTAVRLLIVETEQDGTRVFEPVIINRRVEDPLSELVDRKVNSLQAEIKEKRKKIQDLGERKLDGHHKLPPLVKIRNERIDLLSKIVKEERLLKTLKGEPLQPIRIVTLGGEMAGIEPANFIMRGQKSRAEQMKLDIERLVNVFPEGLNILAEGFKWRSRMLFGATPGERTDAISGYNKFMTRYMSEVPKDGQELLKPFMELISTVFGES